MRLDRKKINLYMARNKVTVSDIAKKCGKSSQWTSKVLNSENPMPKTVGIIADALDVDVAEIIED